MAALMPQGKQQYFTAGGIPLVGGKVYTYAAGTTTPLATYTTAAASTPNANPVILDSRGEASIFFSAANYKIVVKDALDSTIWTQDDLSGDQATKLRTDLAASTGSSLVGHLPSGTGAVVTTVQAKLRDIQARSLYVTDAPYYADNTGATGAAADIQDAINASAGDKFIPDGIYLMDADITVPDNVCIYFGKNAVFKASANGRIFFKSATHAYFSQIHNPQLNGNGKTGVVGFDMTNFRLNAGIFNPYMTLMDTGFIGRDGCFGTPINNPTAYGVTYPIVLTANNSGLVVSNPNFDNSVTAGGTGAGTGVTIPYGAGSNLGAVVHGGYIQGFALGVDDGGIGTIVDSVYFEACTSADVTGNTTVKNSRYKNNSHWGSTGLCAYRLRNTDGVVIDDPVMGSGARTGMFDIDATNTNCTGKLSNSTASFNSPIGTITGIRLSNYVQSFVVTDGSGAALSFTQNATAYLSISGKTVTIAGDITFPVTANASFCAINLPVAGKTGSTVSVSVGYTDYGAALTLTGSGATVGILLTSSGGALQNANLSGKRLAFTFSYIAAE